jgi:hypothetical protein
MGRQWEALIGVPIRPLRPIVDSNAITPRPTANLVWPPLLVVLGLPIVASDHVEQICHGPHTFKGSMAIPPISVSSVSMGGFRRHPRASVQKRTRRSIYAPGVGGSSELVRDYSSISRSLSGSVEVPRTPSVTVP